MDKERSQPLGMQWERIFIEAFFATWMFCNVCPSYSKNRQNVLKTNNLVGVSLTQPFLPMQPGLDSLARSWTRLLPSRELCSPCWQSPTWAHGFLLFLPSLPWVGGLLTVSFLFQQGLGTFAQAVPSPWNTLSSPSVTHSHSSFHLQGWDPSITTPDQINGHTHSHSTGSF